MQFIYFLFVASSVWDNFYNSEEDMQPQALQSPENFSLVRIPVEGGYGDTLTATKTLQEKFLEYENEGEEIEQQLFERICDMYPETGFEGA